MPNAYNTGLVGYKTEKLATMDFITQIVFSHIRCLHLMLAQGHNVLASVCVWCRCTLLIIFTDFFLNNQPDALIIQIFILL
jgi:hypothetical protein